jgi:gas vesicle protein
MRIRRLLGYDMDDVLELVGLQRRSSVIGAVIPAVGFVAIGAVIGAGVGLLFAPSSGRRLRQDMTERLDQMREKMKVEARKQGLLNATPEQEQVSAH